MPFLRKSFLDIKNLNVDSIHHLFEIARKVRTMTPLSMHHKSVAFVFAEPSTRTSSSFEMACHKLGLKVLKLDATFSSLQKGETLLDTLLNLEAMEPDAMIVRHGSSESLEDISKTVRVPIINAGEGTKSHPTQALLDAYTIMEERGKIQGEKILIVGDISHSRVARSNFELFKKLGAEIGVCGPKELLSNLDVKQFDSIEEGLSWASVCMVLRMQRERHSEDLTFLNDAYVRNFRIDIGRLSKFSKEGILMHPGPVNRDFEITSEAMEDSRCRILTQVKNGVLVRGALLSQILGVSI